MTIEDRIREAERALFVRFGLAPVERYVDLPAAGVRILEFGDADAPPVLLLHGIASVTALAAPLLPVLSDRRVIALDWPGHGLSGPIKLNPSASLRQHATDVVTGLLDELGIEETDLVGHSMGGQFGLYTAHAVPERLRRLVLLGAPGGGFRGVHPQPAMRALAVPWLGTALLRIPLPKNVYKKVNEGGLGRGVLDGHPPEIAEIGRLASVRRGFAPSLASFFRAEITPRGERAGVPLTPAELATVRTPVQLIWGRGDAFLPPQAAAASIMALPNASLAEVDGGHAPWLDSPESCADILSAFLAR